MFLLVSSALTLSLIESSYPGSSSQVVAGAAGEMSPNNVTNGHGSFIWNTFTGGRNLIGENLSGLW